MATARHHTAPYSLAQKRNVKPALAVWASVLDSAAPARPPLPNQGQNASEVKRTYHYSRKEGEFDLAAGTYAVPTHKWKADHVTPGGLKW